MNPYRVRDSQRSRVYNAEAACPWFQREHRLGDDSVDGCQAYVNAVLASDWLHREFPAFGRGRRVRVADGRGRRSAGARYTTMSITLPRWARCKAVVLHELAHLLVDSENALLPIVSRETRAMVVDKRLLPAPRHPGHGWRFAQVELALIRHFIGTAAHDALRDAFREHKVRYKAPRVLSPEQRAAAASRFAAIRAARGVEAYAASFPGPVRAAPVAEPIHIADCPR